MSKIPVGVLGATGLIGQYYLHLLKNHPWFEVTFLGGSKEGPYQERVQGKWQLADPISSSLNVNLVESIDEAKKKCAFVFSALPAREALHFEPLYAAAGLPVISNASCHRLAPDVPLVIPEINPDHLELIEEQRIKRGWDKGFIVAKPNCSIQSFMIPLTPLHHKFKMRRLSVTTLQALSGAGSGGVSSLAIQDNVIPFIDGEEEKIEKEPLKIWGKLRLSTLIPARDLSISAHCNRVPVLDGHLACVSVAFETPPTEQEILHCWNSQSSLNLPSAPSRPIIFQEEANRPQPRLDREKGDGMSITVGRLRPCSVFDYRFVGLSHNAIRGGAGGGILIAELLHQKGYL